MFEREEKGSFGKGSFRRERNARGVRGRREGNPSCVVSRPNSLPLPFQTPATQASERGSIYQYKVYERVTFSFKNDI